MVLCERRFSQELILEVAKLMCPNDLSGGILLYFLMLLLELAFLPETTTQCSNVRGLVAGECISSKVFPVLRGSFARGVSHGSGAEAFVTSFGSLRT